MPVRSREEGRLLLVRRGHGDVEGLVERQVEPVEASAKRCERVRVDVSTTSQSADSVGSEISGIEWFAEVTG
jgi:hypothetical protein